MSTRGRGGRGGTGGFKHNPVVPLPPKPAEEAEAPPAAEKPALEDANGNTAVGHEFDTSPVAPPAPAAASRGGRGGRGGGSRGFAWPAEQPAATNEAAQEKRPQPTRPMNRGGGGGRGARGGIRGGFVPQAAPPNEKPAGEGEEPAAKEDAPKRPAFGAPPSGFGSGANGVPVGGGGDQQEDDEKKSFEGTCNYCKEPGHMKDDCPKKKRGPPKCYNCGKEGHISRDCTQEKRTDGEKRPFSGKCFTCDEIGHSSKECPRRDKVVYTCNTTWKEAELNAELLKNIERSGYAMPRKIQSFSMPLILEGRDLIAQSETGSGKSAAFLVPLIHRIHPKVGGKRDVEMDRPFAIVIQPTRELVYQVYEQARKLADKTAVRVVKAYGEYAFVDNAQEVFRGCDLLIATPGRLMHFISSHIVSVGFLEHLVLDEADRLLDEKFGLDIDQILSCIRQSTKAAKHAVSPLQVLLFSATFPDRLEAFGRNVLREDHAVVRNERPSRPNMRIRQTFELVAGEDKKHMMYEYCRRIREEYEQKQKALAAVNKPAAEDAESSVDSSPDAMVEAEEQKKKTVEREVLERPRILVFFGSKIKADAFGFYMTTLGMRSLSVSSGQTQKQREYALSQFRLGHVFLLLTTDVCARGLDIKELDHVLNFDMPKDIPSYVQRIGRTGRLRQGFAHSFIDPGEDREIMLDLVRMLRADRLPVPECLLVAPPPVPAVQLPPVVLQLPPLPASNFGQPPPPAEQPAAPTELGPLIQPPEFSDDETPAGFGIA